MHSRLIITTPTGGRSRCIIYLPVDFFFFAKYIQGPFEILKDISLRSFVVLVKSLQMSWVNKTEACVGLIKDPCCCSWSHCRTWLFVSWTSTETRCAAIQELFTTRALFHRHVSFVHRVAFIDFDPQDPEWDLFAQFCEGSHVIRLQVWLLPAQLFAAEEQGDKKLVSSLLNPFSYLSYEALRT